MASTQSKIFHRLLRLINKKSFLRKQLAAGKFDFYNYPEPPRGISKDCNVKKIKIRERNVFTLSPKKNDGTKHVLYLHGGAYVQNAVIFHWWFLAGLVKQTGCSVTIPDYPLAPVHTYKDAFAMVLELYQTLVATTAPSDLIIMGDSSGGGFALALSQKLKAENTVQPAQIILLSPWLDITLANPGIDAVVTADPFLEKESLQQAGRLYAGDTSPENYLLSPINGSLESLGKISVFAGTKEILVADARKLKSIADEEGIAINYYEYEDMFHAWMFLNFPESKKARREIYRLVQQ